MHEIEDEEACQHEGELTHWFLLYWKRCFGLDGCNWHTPTIPLGVLFELRMLDMVLN
jgi:hypothetical protein